MELTADLPPALVPLAWLHRHAGRAPASAATRRSRSSASARRSSSPTTARPFLQLHVAAPGCSTTTATRCARSATEAGFWRPQPDGRPRGRAVATRPATPRSGSAPSTAAKIELRTDVVARTATAKEYTAGHRLYGLVEGDLLWAFDMAAVGQPHAAARVGPAQAVRRDRRRPRAASARRPARSSCASAASA